MENRKARRCAECGRGAAPKGWNTFDMKLMFTLTLVLMSGFAVAADIDTTTRKEIAHLFDYLQQSDCRFGRNGSWFDTGRAVQHIDKKYQYLLRKNAIRSTENFIDRAASKSSTTGRPYHVDCGDSMVVESAIWFRDELNAYRRRNNAAR